MTLIASFSIDDTSFLLGDLLLSTPIRHSRPVHLPSIGQPAHLFPASSLLVPHSLARKVCQFSNLSIAWAGNYGKAKTLITRLFDETQNTGPIPYDTLQTLLPKLDPTHKVHLLGHLVDPSGSHSLTFGTKYHHPTSSFLNNLKLAGSGTKLFQNYFAHQDPSGLGSFSGNDPGSFGLAVCKALTVTGMLLQLEIGTGKTLADYFGGGYELVALHRNHFTLCNDLMFAFWYAQIDDRGVTISPVMKFFKQSYAHDILTIRTLEMKAPDPANPIFLTERTDEVHYFPPIYRDLPDQEISALPTPDLEASLLCTYILVQSQNGLEVMAQFDWSKTRQIPLRFTHNGTTMMMEVGSDYIRQVFDAIETRRPPT